MTSSPNDSLRLLHELQVHQIELAEQNEALHEARVNLEESTQRYFELFELAPVGLVTINRLGVVHDANILGRQLLEESPGHPLNGSCMFDRLSLPSRMALLHALAGPLAELAGNTLELTVPLRAAPPRILRAWFRTHPGGEEGVMLALMDVTEQRRAEAELAHTRNVLELSNRVARIGYWEIDRATGVAHWSAVARELLELGPDESPMFEDLLAMASSGDAREALRVAHAGAAKSGNSFDVEVQIRMRSGRSRWIRITGKNDTEGLTTLRQFGTLQDIDPQVQAEATRVAHLDAEMASRSKSAFLTRMSHDLRTPLNAVLGFSELLLLNETVMAVPGVAAQVGHLHNAGAVLLEMVNEVLDLTRIESGSLTIALEPLDVDRMVDECLNFVAPLAASREVGLLPPAGPTGLVMVGDRTRARQVVLNLLSNAIKYNRDGGVVRIRIERDTNEVLIAVQDTGIGIAPEKLPKLFLPFNRLGAEQLSIEGTGLGLVIARQLAEAMGGRLEVGSTLGSGSEFTLRLPCAAEPAAQRTAASPLMEVARSTPQLDCFVVLYIEDNPVNVELMRAALSFRRHIRLEVANDGPEGLEMARRFRPDLVLLDMSLPLMDGPAVLAHLRADPALASTPCVAVSANAMDSDIQQALAIGFADYIVKPFALPRLLATVDRMLG